MAAMPPNSRFRRAGLAPLLFHASATDRKKAAGQAPLYDKRHRGYGRIRAYPPSTMLAATASRNAAKMRFNAVPLIQCASRVP